MTEMRHSTQSIAGVQMQSTLCTDERKQHTRVQICTDAKYATRHVHEMRNMLACVLTPHTPSSYSVVYDST